MRLPQKLLTLFAVAGLGVGSLGGAAAQDGEEEIDYSQLEGIEQVVSRSYSIDAAALMSTPEAAGRDITYPSGIVSAYAFVAQFDDDDSAEAGWEMLRSQFDDMDDDATGDEESAITELEVDDLGDHVAGYSAAEAEGGTTLYSTILIAQADEYVYVAVVSTGGENPTVPAMTLAELMMNADAGDGEGEADDEGVYSGGLWDKFPGEDDDFAEGLTIVDAPIYSESDETADELTGAAIA